MFHVVLGLTFLGLGLWGVVDEWYYLKDLLSGAGPVALVLFGAFAIWMSIMTENTSNSTASNSTKGYKYGN